jgi:DNA-binding response OmpR family regulator
VSVVVPCRFLRKNGFGAAVPHVGSHFGAQAMERPAIVVLHIMMPNTNGSERAHRTASAGDSNPGW